MGSTRMSSKLATLTAAAAASVMVFCTAPANAYNIIGTEDQVNGFVGDLFGGMFSNGPYSVASDGESYFNPYNWPGYNGNSDTSDGLNFSVVGYNWYQAAGSIWTPNGYNSWVLPADLSSIGCGTENETTCEPRGHFWSPNAWVPAALGTWVILEWGKGDVDWVGRPGWSDVIITYNDANNNANLLFYSDFVPNGTIPEPSTWVMMLLGFAGLGFAGYRARKQTADIAA